VGYLEIISSITQKLEASVDLPKQQRSVCDVVVEEIYENEYNNSQPCRTRTGIVEDSGAGGPDHKGDEHACARPEEECPATEAVDQECGGCCCPEVEDLEDTVDQGLGIRVFYTHGVEYER